MMGHATPQTSQASREPLFKSASAGAPLLRMTFRTALLGDRCGRDAKGETRK